MELLSFTPNTLVTVAVGQNLCYQEFVAHEEQLHKSDFFYKALKREWREGQTRKIELPDDDPFYVQHYLHFLYTGQIAAEPSFQTLAHLYILGQKFLDEEFKPAVLAQMLQEFQAISICYNKVDIFREAANIIYEGTPPKALGRKLLVDIFHADGDSTWLEGDEYPTEFMHDLLVKYSGPVRRTNYSKLEQLNPDMYIR